MMLEKIYDKYDFDQDYEVYKYGQQVLIFNSLLIRKMLTSKLVS